MDSEKLTFFPPESVEKVERLLDVLEEMVEHPLLKGRFAMYGGTAINLFMLDIPRLSVDIDATYIGGPDKGAMLAAKPEIEEAISAVVDLLVRLTVYCLSWRIVAARERGHKKTARGGRRAMRLS